MSLMNLKKSWCRLPTWGALMLGLGGLVASGARADKSEFLPLGTTPESVKQLGSSFDEAAIRTEGEKIYISERGGAFEELLLGDTAEAAHLRGLLRDAGAAHHPVAAPVGSIIVANGGGAGNGTKPKQSNGKKSAPKPAPASNPAKEN
jgi:hypothetical protein